jgi:hypothetical protein
MKEATNRSIFRWIHLVFSIPILGYIYNPFDKIPNYAPATRFVFVPLMVLSGYGCGKAMSFGDFFRKDRRAPQVRTRMCDVPYIAPKHRQR